MTSEEILEQMENEEVLCDYCNIKNECPRGMVCYGGEPIEPACFYADLTELIDKGFKTVGCAVYVAKDGTYYTAMEFGY